MKTTITWVGFLIGLPLLLCGFLVEYMIHSFVMGRYLYHGLLDWLLGKMDPYEYVKSRRQT